MIPNHGMVSTVAISILVASLGILWQIRRLFSHYENPSNVTLSQNPRVQKGPP